MGSYNIIMFVLLVLFGGFLSLFMILYMSGIVDAGNVMINAGILSVDTVNTVNTIKLFILASPLIMLLAVTFWAISGQINRKDGD